MKSFNEIKSLVNKELLRKEILSSEIEETEVKISKLKQDIKNTLEAQSIIQIVAQETQQQVEYQISKLVTLALKSVYSRPYSFKIKFVQRRGKTECDLKFEKKGIEFEPYNEVGGGVLDVAAFALRISLWAIQKPRSRNVFIFDEPFKNINDPKRVLHKKVAEMVRMVSEMMDIQIIMTSCIPEMEDIADRIFAVSNKKGRSIIRREL